MFALWSPYYSASVSPSVLRLSTLLEGRVNYFEFEDKKKEKQVWAIFFCCCNHQLIMPPCHAFVIHSHKPWINSKQKKTLKNKRLQIFPCVYWATPIVRKNPFYTELTTFDRSNQCYGVCVYFQAHTAVPLEHTYLADGEYTTSHKKKQTPASSRMH